jgi:hypothetical protein
MTITHHPDCEDGEDGLGCHPDCGEQETPSDFRGGEFGHDYSMYEAPIRNAVRWFHAWGWKVELAVASGAFGDNKPLVVVPVESYDLQSNAQTLHNDLGSALSPKDFENIMVVGKYYPDGDTASVWVGGVGLLGLQWSVEKDG